MNRRNVLLGSIAALVATQIPFVPKSKAAEQVLLWAPTIWQYKFTNLVSGDITVYGVSENLSNHFITTIGCPIDRFLMFSHIQPRDFFAFNSVNFVARKDPLKPYSFKTFKCGNIGVCGFVEATENDKLNPIFDSQFILDHVDDYKRQYSLEHSRIYDMSEAHWMNKDQWLRETRQVKGI